MLVFDIVIVVGLTDVRVLVFDIVLIDEEVIVRVTVLETVVVVPALLTCSTCFGVCLLNTCGHGDAIACARSRNEIKRVSTFFMIAFTLERI